MNRLNFSESCPVEKTNPDQKMKYLHNYTRSLSIKQLKEVFEIAYYDHYFDSEPDAPIHVVFACMSALEDRIGKQAVVTYLNRIYDKLLT